MLAVNTYGESEPAVTNEPILAKNASDPPGQPGPVSLVNWGQSFCALKWDPPGDNGGSAITSYIVEVLEKGFHDWREALTTHGNEVEGTVKPPIVMEFREYRFRVVAFNEMGPSEPSHPTEFVQMKERFVKPKIEKSASRKRVLKANLLAKIEARFEGEPQPEVTWQKPNMQLITQDDECFTIENLENHTTLVIRRPQRSDSGLFKLSVKNSGGIDSADIEVAVVSAPNQPTGPLDVQDVTGSSCHLIWKAPTDDGGDKITHYLVERRDNRNNIWQPSGKCLATHMAVSDLSNGLDYIFRVKAVNSEGDSPFLQAENMSIKSIIRKG